MEVFKKAKKKPKLINEKTLAKLLDVSLHWVRSQRYLRYKGKKHSLTIDPIRIGMMVRYKLSDVEDWINNQPKACGKT